MFGLDLDEITIQKGTQYPEASSKVSQYEALVSDLESHKKYIDDLIRLAEEDLYRDIGDLESSDLSGAYYNTYINKKNDWKTQCSDMISKFDTFLEDLQGCIDEANQLKQMWIEREQE